MKPPNFITKVFVLFRGRASRGQTCLLVTITTMNIIISLTYSEVAFIRDFQDCKEQITQLASASF